MAAGQFKARCLAVLDDVAETGIAVVVTKRGRPVARVVPIDPREKSDLKGSVVREGDLLSPIDASWSADR
jgi:prevent-host-death family protein